MEKTKLQMSQECTRDAGVVVELGVRGLRFAAHFEKHVLLWSPSSSCRSYLDHLACSDGRFELGPPRDGALLVTIRETSVPQAVRELLTEQRLSAECVLVESDADAVVDWTDGVCRIATRYLEVCLGVTLECEYRRSSESCVEWDPLSDRAEVSLLRFVEVSGVLRRAAWPSGLLFQQVWE